MIDTQDDEGFTPLMSSSRFGQVETTKLLIDEAANVENKDQNGRTALMWACRFGKKIETVELLIG